VDLSTLESRLPDNPPVNSMISPKKSALAAIRSLLALFLTVLSVIGTSTAYEADTLLLRVFGHDR